MGRKLERLVIASRVWHADCFRKSRQARKQLNRDPAAITSLSVACRYASRPPSDPTYLPYLQEPGPKPGSPAFGAKVISAGDSRLHLLTSVFFILNSVHDLFVARR